MFEIRQSAEFANDLRRLFRFDPDCAEELRDIVSGTLQENGRVPESYNPHPLTNPGGIYNGCVEFHLRDDVLVLYRPQHPRHSVSMLRICTHKELQTGHFHKYWPKD